MMVSLEAINMPPKTGNIHRSCLLAILGARKSATLTARNSFHHFSDYQKIRSISQQICMFYPAILRDIMLTEYSSMLTPNQLRHFFEAKSLGWKQFWNKLQHSYFILCRYFLRQ